MSVEADLATVAVVDNHCHSVERLQDHRDLARWRAFFTESRDPATRAVDVASTAFYRRLITELSALHRVPATEEAVLGARDGSDAAVLTRRMFLSAGVHALVVDTGFPDPAVSLDIGELAEAAGCRAAELLRLEPMLETLVARCSRYSELLDAVRATLRDARSKGWSGFKTIAGYRTGLDIRRWPSDDVDDAFAAARREVAEHGSVRLGHKPLLDSLLHEAFAVAATEDLPVQVHVGYGDADVDLRAASPLLLRELLEEPAYRGVPFVLLHGCWPYVREGAFLAAVYGNVHLDLSYGIPFLSRAELRDMTRAALGTAPATRLLYSSDGSRVPELHWMGARDGRRVLGSVLDELVEDGDLTGDQARDVGRMVLRTNALRLYGIGAGR